jgi:L-2-hydroxyglutarate oxidase
MQADITIIGAGIVGLSTAYHLCHSHPNLKVVVLEKEPTVARHQSGHNSGVIHSGIYYKPGSFKAQFCMTARRKLIDFCRRFDIAYDICGKIILATEESEYDAFEALLLRGRENGVICRELSQSELRMREPHVAPGRAILVEEAGIVDYVAVCEKLKELIIEKGGVLLYNSPFIGLKEVAGHLSIKTPAGIIDTARLINCAGLYADRIAKVCQVQSSLQIVPFRGEYYSLAPAATPYCQHLIYPVPDARFPFLGVHLTRMISGGVECGPNAVLALAREGYRWRDIHVGELLEILAFKGFQQLMRKHWRTGLGECRRSLSKRQFCASLQKLVPNLKPSDIHRGQAGIRAQAISPDGTLADDFIIEEGLLSIHVLNAPSPAATSSLEIGRHIAQKQIALL